MNMLSVRLAMCLGLAFAAAGLAFSAEDKEDGKDEAVSMDKVPAVVADAAKGAVKDLVLTGAEMETKGSVVVYELKGTAGGKEYEVKVTADGNVLKAKEEKAEKEDDDKDEEAGSKGEKEDDDGDDDDDDDDDDK